jgi:adenosylhomocysteine nucleosidase
MTVSDILFVSATAEEAAHLPPGSDVLVTGVGTISATIALGRRLADGLPGRLVNVGTAGALIDGRAGVYEITAALQHDFSDEMISIMTGRPYPNLVEIPTVTDLPKATLATGDAFISDSETRARLARRAELVDMEGYAVARVGAAYGVPVTLLKQVSDSADEAASLTWFDAVDRGARELAQAVAAVTSRD